MSESPIFICEFLDGEVTRMTTWCESPKKLDVERGVRLARCAYFSRKHEAPPAIKAARFEKDGAMLESYSAVDLEDIEERPIEDFDAKAFHAGRDAPVSPSWQTYDELADDAAEEPPL